MTSLEWDGAERVKDADGDTWRKRPDGRYGLEKCGIHMDADGLEFVHGPCKAVDRSLAAHWVVGEEDAWEAVLKALGEPGAEAVAVLCDSAGEWTLDGPVRHEHGNHLVGRTCLTANGAPATMLMSVAVYCDETSLAGQLEADGWAWVPHPADVSGYTFRRVDGNWYIDGDPTCANRTTEDLLRDFTTITRHPAIVETEAKGESEK